MKIRRPIATLAALLGSALTSSATVIGFGDLGGNNFNIESVAGGLGSNALANTNGVVVDNGTTPNVALSWGPGSEWDIHTSTFFNPLESQTVGGGSWDNQGNVARVGQLDYGGTSTTTGQYITFTLSDPTSIFRLNSFDFGHSAEAGNATTTAWTLSLTNPTWGTVWSQTVNFTGGQVYTISPNFYGVKGESYTLNFFRTSQSYASAGRHGIDNLSFSQTPEPGSAMLLGVAGMGLLARRKKK